VVETLPFESTLQIEAPVIPGVPMAAPKSTGIVGIPLKLDRKTMLLGGGAAVGILIAIGFLVAVFLRKRKKKKGMPTSPAALAAGESPAARAALGATSEDLERQLAERDAQQEQSDAQVLTSFRLAPVITKKAEILAKHLREKISKNPEVSAQILRTWIREEDQ
jgi:flagellar biosynthesis/type III secretory pathway M-ring protein FliF/YscJ